MSERIRRAEDGTIVLDDLILMVAPGQPVHAELVNVFGRKSNQGSPGPNDHPLNDTWIMDSWAGGGQVKFANPASHTDRFDWAQAYTQRPRGLTLPRKSVGFLPGTPSVSNPIVHGDFPPGTGARSYASWGVDLERWTEATKTWAAYAVMALPAVREWTVFTLQSGANKGQKRAFIPQGSNYGIFDGTTVVSGGQAAIDFVVWDDKLFRLDSSGNLDWTQDGTTWQATPIATIPDGSVPQLLVDFYDASKEPTIYVVTDGSVWGLDFNFGKLRRTDLYYPRTPYQGLAATVWRAQLYTSAGIGVHQYQPGVISPVGLDRDDSLPPEYRGYISDLEAEYNGFYALVAGIPTGIGSSETATLSLGAGDDQLYASLTSLNALLMVWNGVGWHYVWSKGGATPTNVVVSMAEDAYRLWWGAGGKAWSQVLPRTYFNPRDSVGFPYEPTGFYESSWWDWGWQGTPKVVKHIELEVDNIPVDEDGNPTSAASITVGYKLDDDTNPLVTVGTITANGEYSFPLGENFSLEMGYGDEGGKLYEGVVCEKFKLRFDLAGDPGDDTIHPVIKWHTAVSRKFLRPQRSWRLVVDARATTANNPSHDLWHKLEDLVVQQRAVTFVHLHHVYMVDVVAFSGDQLAGGEEGYIRLNLIESHEAV